MFHANAIIDTASLATIAHLISIRCPTHMCRMHVRIFYTCTIRARHAMMAPALRLAAADVACGFLSLTPHSGHASPAGITMHCVNIRSPRHVSLAT